jgi:hypothetical protein
MKAAAKDAPFGLRAETAANRDEKDPGMRVSQAMTRATPTSVVGKSDDIRVRRLPVVNRGKRFVGSFVDWKRRDARESWALANH